MVFFFFLFSRKEELSFSVKKTEQYFAENVIYRFTKPTNTLKNTIGFF